MLMVAHVHSNWNQLLAELTRWERLSVGNNPLGTLTLKTIT